MRPLASKPDARGRFPQRGIPPTRSNCASRGPRFRTLLAVAAFLNLVVAGLAPPASFAAESAWWNADWQYRKAITIKLPIASAATLAPSGLAALPPAIVLPIRLHAGNFQYFQDLQPTGADLRFVADDGTPLEHQLEMLDPAIGLLVAWVRIPVRAGGNEQRIWMYYGNPHASQSDTAPLYDAEQTIVLHFGETQGLPRDATANHDDATASTAQVGVPGVIGNGARFDGRSAVEISSRPALAVRASGGLTFSAWVQLDADSPRAVLYSQSQGDRRIEIGMQSSRLYADIATDSGHARVESTNSMRAHEWHHVMVSMGGGAVTLYLDGAPAGSATNVTLPDLRGDVFIGGEGVSAGGGGGAPLTGLAGILDEVEIAKIARSPWWARVNALSQTPDTTIVAYGTDESKGTAGKFAAYLSMMRNLLGQVSLDGLVVITITALMGLASFQVLLSKADLLRRVEREDERFLGAFAERLARDLATDAAGAGTNDSGEYPASGLYAMYRAGLRGLDAVVTASGSTRSALKLGAEAFEAVRTALDGELVEATDRLNARLVVMTVAIAGAPFLGLLGTVVGVMITFASIAAAGDVNVNTIAPGVAAAMTATVVGLLVAIPSLFGYNWLATRIGRRTSAMEVFADRFMSGIALLALASETALSAGRTAPAERTVHAA